MAQLAVAVAAGVVTAAVLYIARRVGQLPGQLRKHTEEHLQMERQVQVNTEAIDLITRYLVREQGRRSRPERGTRER